MKRTNQARKLRLDRSILRMLSTNELRSVVGGGDEASSSNTVIDPPALGWNADFEPPTLSCPRR